MTDHVDVAAVAFVRAVVRTTPHYAAVLEAGGDREAHCRATSHVAQQLDVPTVHLENVAADSETQAMSPPELLRGEAVFKNTRDQIRRNTSTRIGNVDVDCGRTLVGQVLDTRCNLDASTARY